MTLTLHSHFRKGTRGEEWAKGELVSSLIPVQAPRANTGLRKSGSLAFGNEDVCTSEREKKIVTGERVEFA